MIKGNKRTYLQARGRNAPQPINVGVIAAAIAATASCVASPQHTPPTLPRFFFIYMWPADLYTLPPPGGLGSCDSVHSLGLGGGGWWVMGDWRWVAGGG